MQFEIEFDTTHLENIMAAIRQEIATPQQMLGSIGESLLRVNNERHEKGLAPDGTPWKPLAKSTLEQGNRRGGPLNKTGDLLRSFHYQVSQDNLILGFDGAFEAKKALWHHFGTKPYIIRPINKKALVFAGVVVKRVNHPGLPARPLVGFPDSDKQLVAEVTADHLKRTLNRIRTSS
jgi:phage gpG-like protein